MGVLAACGSDRLAALFVTLQAGLDSLAITHHLLAPRLVGEVVIVNVLVFVAPHARLPALGGPRHVEKLVWFLTRVTLSATHFGVLVTQDKLGLLAMIGLEARRLPRRFWVAVLTGRWVAEFLEAIFVRIVLAVALGTGWVGLACAELFGVAFVASELGVATAQIKARASSVIKLELLETSVLWRVTPVAGLLVKEHVLVW